MSPQRIDAGLHGTVTDRDATLRGFLTHDLLAHQLLDREVFEPLRWRGTRDRLRDACEGVALTADPEACLVGLHRNLVTVDHGRRRLGYGDCRNVAGTQGAAKNEEKDRAPQGEPI